MAVLSAKRFTVMTTGDLVDRLVSGAPLPDRCVALTFDDGLQDFRTGALPILQRTGFPATLYVVAGLVGRTSRWLAPLGEGDRPMLTVSELRDVAASGVEIGGHSMSHPELDVLDRKTAYREISQSRLVLQDLVGAPVRSFAYPHGYASRETRRLVREAGYSSAVRFPHALSGAGEDIFGLSRLDVTEALDEDGFAAMLEGRDVSVSPPQDRLAARGWRLARRFRYRRQAQRLQPA